MTIVTLIVNVTIFSSLFTFVYFSYPYPIHFLFDDDDYCYFDCKCYTFSSLFSFVCFLYPYPIHFLYDNDIYFDCKCYDFRFFPYLYFLLVYTCFTFY